MSGLLLATAILAGPAPEAIAIQWRSGAEGPPEPSVRATLREAVAAHDDRPLATVVDRALARARVAVSRERPASLRAVHRNVRATLDRADAAYRGGRFDDARVELGAALEQLHTHPELPGAAASAREAHLLAAKIAWALGDEAGATLELADALRVDPQAQLSVREAAPALIERYHAIQTELLASRDSAWIEPEVTLDAAPDTAIIIEIDGVLGPRPVPPGPHFIVVYRDGHQPQASWHPADQPWQLPHSDARLPDDPDTTIEAVCETLALDILLLAEHRGARIGLQAHRCGAGFGPIWTGTPEQLDEGVSRTLAGPHDRPALGLDALWPVTIAEGPIEIEPLDRDDRPWYRRAWIWGTSAGVAAVVVAGVVAGVVLANQDPAAPSIDVDSGPFIGSP